MKWLFPAITGSLLIKLGSDANNWLGVAGIALGAVHIFFALVVAWAIYVANIKL